MKEVRFGIIGMGVQGSLYASILTGRQHPGRSPIPQPKGCVLTAICSRSDKTAEAAELGVRWLREMVPNPCDSARFDAELQRRMDEDGTKT